MDADNCRLAAGFVSQSYISQGAQALASRRGRIKALLSNRRLPAVGWDDDTIEMLVKDAALMDSNNFPDNVGVGEREARVACRLVARRHYGLAHGIGRSGDIAAEQPKAAGSSLLAKLTVCLATDALRLAGLPDLTRVTVLPLATGMAMTSTLLALRAQRPGADCVVWSRIDQKTCLKAITAAALQPLVVELAADGDQLVTDVAAVAAQIQRVGAARVLCVLTTSSCFAPRAADDVVAVAKLCAAAGVPHVINNAYGVQSAVLCRDITSACRKGRVDAVVQSTDKNFLVPVGGAVVAAPSGRPAVVDGINGLYPGRASASSHLDLLMTLLHLGAAGWIKLLSDREQLFEYLKGQLTAVAAVRGERVLSTPGNPISLAVTLDALRCGPDQQEALATQPQQQLQQQPQQEQGQLQELPPALCTPIERPADIAPLEPQPPDGAVARAAASGSRRNTSVEASSTFFGSMLWSRFVSGTRVVAQGNRQSVGGLMFDNYGAHTNSYKHTYMTAAAAIGGSSEEVDEFVSRLGKAFDYYAVQQRRQK